MGDEAGALRRGAGGRACAPNRWIASRSVEAAFRAVPRHAFLPDLPLAEVYSDRSIAIKLEDGVPISSSSQPAIMAVMLELLEPQPGDRVLEIGTGSGYNAALLAALVAPHGTVTTVDLDRDLVDAARARLDEAGFATVRTRCGDGAQGVAEDAPFDALIATVAVDGVPAAWHAQLRAGGRLVMPLAIRLNQKVVAFERLPRAFASTAVVEAAFMPLRGSFAAPGRVQTLGDPTVVLRVLDDRPLDAGALVRALRAPASDHALHRPLTRYEAVTAFAFWLGLHDDAFCRLSAHGESSLRDVIPDLAGTFAAYGRAGTLGLCVGDELALLAPAGDGTLASDGAPASDEDDVVVRRFGPDAGGVARIRAALAAWDAAGRPGSDRLHIEATTRDDAAICGDDAPSLAAAQALALSVRWR